MTNPIYSLLKGAFLCVLLWRCQSEQPNTLRVSEINPRYFTDNSGKAIYLTGSHTWDNLVDMHYAEKGQQPFYYPAYLTFLKEHRHNFIRLWTWDLLMKFFWKTDQSVLIPLHPWERSGTGEAVDGNPKFDLTQFNDAYFDRLRERVAAAEKEGIYVAVMLFEGFGIQFVRGGYRQHPFYPLNNVNELALDTAYESRRTIYTLADSKVTRLQESYVRKVIETVGGFDNVLYEISNEQHGGSTEWQYHMIRFVKEIEKERGVSHPVGMTFQFKGGTNENLFNSPADWISPNPDDGYKTNPPASTGDKIIINDTDHLWGIGGNREWVWKSFLRGMNTIFMDPYMHGEYFTEEPVGSWEETRVAMGRTLEIANHLDLINMTPDSTLTTSKYSLANPGKEYLVYLPEQTQTELDLSEYDGAFDVSWFDSINGTTRAGTAVTGGGKVMLISPFESIGGVAHLKLQ